MENTRGDRIRSRASLWCLATLRGLNGRTRDCRGEGKILQKADNLLHLRGVASKRKKRKKESILTETARKTKKLGTNFTGNQRLKFYRLHRIGKIIAESL